MKIDPTKPPNNTEKELTQVISPKPAISKSQRAIAQAANSTSLAAAGKTRVQVSNKFGTVFDTIQEQQIILEAFCALNPTEAIFIETRDDGKFFLANDKILQGKTMEGVILEHKLDAQETDVLAIINYSDSSIKIANVISISPYNSFETGWYVTNSSPFDLYKIHWGKNFEYCFDIPFISPKTSRPETTLILMRNKHIEPDDPRSLKIEVPDLSNAQVLALVKKYESISGVHKGILHSYENDPDALNSIQHKCITPLFPGECESIRISGKRIFKIYDGKAPVYDRGFDVPIFESGVIIYKGATSGYIIQPEVDMTATIQDLSDFEDRINLLGYEFIDPSLGQIGFYDNELTRKRELVLIDPRSVRQSANPTKYASPST